jgi:hypothetical protein
MAEWSGMVGAFRWMLESHSVCFKKRHGRDELSQCALSDGAHRRLVLIKQSYVFLL